jgi:anti-anti-sigma regulatory factor
VDLAHVPLIDAAGVGALVAGRSTAYHGGAQFRLDRSQQCVVDVLSRAGLGAAFGLLPVPVRQRAARVAQTTLPV